MAIILYLSGGAANGSAVASLGGARSVTSAPAGTRIFGQPTSSVYANGVTYYCCLYVVSTTAASNILAFIKNETPSTSTTVALGWGTSAADGTEQTVGARTTAPAGVTFSTPSSIGAAISGGALGANQHKAIWIRYTIQPMVNPPITETFTLTFDNPPVVGQNEAVRLVNANKWANVTISPTPTTGNNTDRYLRGGDFNTAIWASQGTWSWWELFISGNSNPATVTTYGETSFKDVTVRGGGTQRVISFAIKADAPNTTVEQIRVTEYQSAGVASGTTRVEPVFYQRMYVKFDERTLTRARRVGAANFYQIFWEAKCEPDFRLRGQLQYDATLDKLYWVSHTDVLTNATRIHNGENKTVNVILSAENSSSGWHRIEIWCNRPSQIFRMAVDGSDIINLTGANLYGVSGNILNFPMFTQVYATTSMSGPSSEKPIEMLVDDFELWTKPPTDAWATASPPPAAIPAGANESTVMLSSHIDVPYTRFGISAWETPFIAGRQSANTGSYYLNRYCAYSGSQNLCTSLGYLMADSSRYTAFRNWIAHHAAKGAKVLVQIFPENIWGSSTTITLAQATAWRDAIKTMLDTAHSEAPGTVYGVLLGNEPTFPNEPGANSGETWRGGWPSGSSTLYALHARLAKQTVNAYYPNVKVIGPEIPSLDNVRVDPCISAMNTASAAGHDIGWGTGAGTFLKDWLDEFSWHGYLWNGGDFNPLDGGFAAINTLKTKLAGIGFTKPIAQTEFMVTYPGNGEPNATWARIVEKICRKHPAEFATGNLYTINFEWGSSGGPNAVFDDNTTAGATARTWWSNYVNWWKPSSSVNNVTWNDSKTWNDSTLWLESGNITIGRIAQLTDNRIRVYRSDGDTLVIPTDLTNGKFGSNP